MSDAGFDPNICSNAMLRQATRRMGQLYDDALAPSGLRATQYSLLAQIIFLDEPTMRALAAEIVMDLSALGHALKPLVREGWVELVPDPRDRRAKRVRLTAQGQLKFAEATPLWGKAHGAFEAAFGAEKAAELRAVLGTIVSDDFGRRFTAQPATVGLTRT